MLQQAKRGICAAILAVFLATSATSSVAAGELGQTSSKAGAAELFLLTMLMAAAMDSPTDSAAASSRPNAEPGTEASKSQIACASNTDCSGMDPNVW
jgi:hypothetical protein